MINKPYRSAMARSMPGWEWVTNRTFAPPATTNYRTVLVISGIYMLICPSTTSVISSTSSSFWKWSANSAAGSCFLMIKSISICSKWGSWRKDTQKLSHVTFNLFSKNQIFDERVKRSLVSAADRDKGKDEFIYELNPWDALQILTHIP